MQFRKTTTISVADKTKPIFETLEQIRLKEAPHLSFSLFLATVIEKFVKTQSKNAKITEFDSLAVSTKFPLIMSSMEKWNSSVCGLSNDDLIKLQDRLTQLANLTRKEVSKRL